MPSLFERIKGYIGTPIKGEMDLWNVILVTIIIATVVVIWTRVLRNVT